ncbi:MAG: hypothetical protein ACE5DI_00415 [Candidatus Micrarchaeia archaeon]
MFKAYDVRGKYDVDVTEEKFVALGKALFSSSNRLVLGRDFRKSSKTLSSALAQGFASGGGSIDFLGEVPSPTVAFLSKDLGSCITASHNSAEYNGAKFFKHKRCFFSGELSKLKEGFEKVEKVVVKSVELTEQAALVKEYEESLPEFKGGLYDLAGGAACGLKKVFPKVVFDSPDPLFERHSAEPKGETLARLKRETLRGRLVGFAFDGDADRLAVCDKGKVVEGDVLAAFVVSNFFKKKDKVVLSVDCSSEVSSFLENEGFKVFWAKVGDVNVLSEGLHRQAAFAAERSGHYSFFSHMPYSDALYASALLSGSRPGALFDFAGQFKSVVLTDALYVSAGFSKISSFLKGQKGFLSESTVDGVKAEFEDFSLLIRASNTEPKIRVNSEAKDGDLAKEGLSLAKQAVESAKN